MTVCRVVLHNAVADVRKVRHHSTCTYTSFFVRRVGYAVLNEESVKHGAVGLCIGQSRIALQLSAFTA